MQARPSARPPIDTSRNFPLHVSAESPSNIGLELVSKNPKKNKKKSLRGPEAVPNIFGVLIPPFWVCINTLYSFRILAKPLLLFSKKTLKNLKMGPGGGVDFLIAQLMLRDYYIYGHSLSE